MLIFGFGKKTFKVLGETEKKVCKKCNNERKFKYIEEKTWFSLFFLPVIPYKTRKLFICPVCSMGFEVKGEVNTTPMKKPATEAELNQEKESSYKKIKKKFEEGEISKNEFIRMCNILNYEVKTSQ